MITIDEKLEICDTIHQAIAYILSQTEISDEFYNSLVELSSKLGQSVNQTPPIPTNSIDSFLKLYEWVDMVKFKLSSVQPLPKSEKQENKFDREFQDLVLFVNSNDTNTIVENMVKNFKQFPLKHRKLCSNYAQKYKFWGDIDAYSGGVACLLKEPKY